MSASSAPWRGGCSSRPRSTARRRSPGSSTYALLFLWTLVVLVPLYWVLITSFKGPGEVDNGPFYIPFVDFTPSLQAWDFMLLQNHTLAPTGTPSSSRSPARCSPS